MPDLVWRREKPTKKGVYAWRESPYHMHLMEFHEDSGGLYCTLSCRNHEDLGEAWKTRDVPSGGYWFGPMPTLVETKAERSE